MLSTAPELSAVLRPLALWPLLERRGGAADEVFFLFFLDPVGRPGRRCAVAAVDEASVAAVPGGGGGASSELPSISDSMTGSW
jgi:hypothetical protein